MSVQTKTVLKSYFQTGDAPTQAQFSDLIESLRGEIVYALDFGAVGDGVVNNKTAIQNAVDFGVAEGLPVHFGKGTYLVTHSASGQGIAVTGDLVIEGSGPDKTIIQFGPNSPTYPYDGFAQSLNTKLTFRNLTIRGPAAHDGTGTNTEAQAGFETKGIRIVGGDSSETILDNVRIDQQFRTAIELGGTGNAMLDLRNSYFTAWGQVLSAGGETGTYKRVHATNCNFPGQIIQDTTQYHTLYPGPSVSLRLSGCRFAQEFGGSGGASAHSFGTALGTPQYLEFTNCEFGPGVGGILFSQGRLKMQACTFKDAVSAFYLNWNDGAAAASLNVVGCEFINTPVTAANATATGASRNVFTSCIFTTSTVECVWADSNWRFANCYFNGVANFIVNTAKAIATLDVVDCTFEDGTDRRAILTNKGVSVRVARCTFKGAFYQTIEVPDVAASPMASLVVEDCDFREATSWPIVLELGWAGVLRGSGNKFHPSWHPTAAGDYQLLIAHPGMHPTVLASAATLYVPADVDAVHLSGTTAVDTIRRGIGSASVNPTLCFTGPLTVVADNAAGLTINHNTGNIKGRAAANIVLAQNDAVTLYYDPRTAFWYQQ